MNNQIYLSGIFQNGYGFIAKMVMQDQELTLQEKGVYAYLCSFSGRGIDAFPSRQKICDDLKISNDSLGKYLKGLTNSGYISITQSKNETKFGNNIYTINLEKPCRKFSVSEKSDTNNNNILNNNNNNIYLKENKPKKQGFIPPTVEEIRQYCRERNNNVDAQRFFDYYSSNDWKDNQGKQVKNWKQKIIANWEKNASNSTTQNNNTQNTGNYHYEIINGYNTLVWE